MRMAIIHTIVSILQISPIECKINEFWKPKNRRVIIPKNMVIIGEVGLTGEVRRINLIEKRLKEAERLGFKSCIIPESNKKDLKDKYKLDIIGVGNVNEAMKKALG